MRFLIVSDLHSNAPALIASLSRARKAGFDEVLCCGDLVGYGPDPVEVIDCIRGLNARVIRGNHDRAAAGLDDLRAFNPHAREAILWTQRVLPPAETQYLVGLPVGPESIGKEGQLVHGSTTGEDDYVFTEEDADSGFLAARRRITFFGHSHIPGVFSANSDGLAAGEFFEEDGGTVSILPSRSYLINPGSVGQPRDGDVRASFAIWDTQQSRVEFYRAGYNVAATQDRMRRVGLPDYLINRLSFGK